MTAKKGNFERICIRPTTAKSQKFFFSKSSSCWISIYDKFTRAWIFCTAPIISAKSLEQQQFVKNSKYWQLSIMEFAKATWSRRQNSTLLIALNAYDFWTVWQLNPFPYDYHLFLKNICLGKSSWHNEIWTHDFSQRLRDIISQPLLKSTCVFGPKKGVTCRPVYDNKFCFLSCIVGTCADGPIFLFKVERANKKRLSQFYYSTLLLCFAPSFPWLFCPPRVFLEFLRIYRDIFTQLSPIISWHDMTCKDTDSCLCLWLGSLFPNEMYLSFEQECNWTPKNGSASATIVALATALPLGMVLTFLQCYVTGWNWSRFGLRPRSIFMQS